MFELKKNLIKSLNLLNRVSTGHICRSKQNKKAMTENIRVTYLILHPR